MIFLKLIKLFLKFRRRYVENQFIAHSENKNNLPVDVTINNQKYLAIEIYQTHHNAIIII